MIDSSAGNILIDTHCHLNDPSFNDTLDEVIGRAAQAGVMGFVVPAYDRDSLPRTAELQKKYPGKIFAAFGLHPWFLDDGGLDDIEKYLRSETAIAVGEIGLDFSPGMPSAGLQEKCLASQLDMAAHLALPAIVHCRKAYEKLFDILAGYKGKIRIILHSFSGGPEIMKQFLGLGCWISFSGSVTRDNAKKYHRCAGRVPPDRFLIETDAPSIATRTTVASLVEPCHASEVAMKIANLRNTAYEDICRYSTANARHIFGIAINETS
jgi:TatD DNase family protein